MAPLTLYTRLEHWAFSQTTPGSQVRTLLKSITRIIMILVHVFFKTQLSLRASALTFSIILSLVPMLAMSTAILKGLGSDNDLKIAAYRLIEQIVPDSGWNTLPLPGDDVLRKNGGQISEKTSTAAEHSMATHLRNAVDMIFDYVDRTNFAALGAFGIIGLLFVVLLMLNNIEVTMNVIWHSTKSRPLGRKIMDYLALLILLPISLNAALAGGAILQSKRMMGYITTIVPSEWLIGMLLKGLPFLFIVASLTFMYQFFPYARVKTGAAFTGAFFASLFWFIILQLYIGLQIGVSQYNAIYGSFATVPLFLIWLHLGWIFLLLGAALAYAVQNRNRYDPRTDRKITPRHRLQIAFDILHTVYTNFNHRQATDIEQLASALPGEPVSQLAATVELLVAGGLLHALGEHDDLTVTPAQPLEQLEAGDVLTVILGRDSAHSPGGLLAEKMIDAAASKSPHPLFSINHQYPHAENN